MQITGNIFLSFLIVLTFFCTPDLPANPQNFYQQHLRSSRNASDQNEVRASKAMGKLAARISGQPLPRSISPAAATTITSDADVIELLKTAPGHHGLGVAQSLKSRLSHQNLLLEEYIARCYWAVGENTRAAELSNALLIEYESPSLRRFLANDAQKKGSHELAKHHLAKSDVTETKMLFVRLQIWLSEVSLFTVLFAVLFLFIMFYKKPGIKAFKIGSQAMGAAETAKVSQIIENEASKSDKTDNNAKLRKSFSRKGKNKQTKTSVIHDLKPVREGISGSAFSQPAPVIPDQTNEQANHTEFLNSPAQTIMESSPVSAHFPLHSDSAPETIDKSKGSDFSIPDESPRPSLGCSNDPSAKLIREGIDLPTGSRHDVLEQHFDNQLGFIEPKSARLFFLGLQLALSDKMMRTLGITSSTENANRALAAFQLAKMFADDDYQTLLIDANDSGQFLHEIYCCEPAPGLADLINPDNSFATVFKKTEQTQLTLLTCGSEATGFSDLSNQALELLLSYCRKNFEIIILILPVATRLQEKLSIIKNFGVVFLDCYPPGEGSNFHKLPMAANSLSVLGKILSNQE